MCTDRTEILCTDNFWNSFRNACKVSTATEVRFQNVAIIFISWIVARKKNGFVSINLRKLLGLEKFWIFWTISNLRSGSLKCAATFEAVAASETSSPVVSFVRLCGPTSYISRTQGGSFMFHTWYQVHVTWVRVQHMLKLSQNLASKTWMASNCTLPEVKLINFCICIIKFFVRENYCSRYIIYCFIAAKILSVHCRNYTMGDWTVMRISVTIFNYVIN
jgi:hypothetical protein